jgi:hypothetical protein
MNLALEIRTDRKRNLEKIWLQFFFSLFRDLEQTNELRCELASYLKTS